MIKRNYRLTNFNSSFVGKLALTNTYASLDSSFEDTDSGLVYVSSYLKVFNNIILGELDGNYFIDYNGKEWYQVRLFCPIWNIDGTPSYFITAKREEIDVITDIDARKQQRMVFKDYRDRSTQNVSYFDEKNCIYDPIYYKYTSRYQWSDDFMRNWMAAHPTWDVGFDRRAISMEISDNLFPYTDISYNQLCYNRNFDKLGSQDIIDAYFNNATYDMYLDAFVKFKSFRDNDGDEYINNRYRYELPIWKDFFGTYKGNKYDNSPTYKTVLHVKPEQMVVERNEVQLNGVMYYPGKQKKEHGIVYSKTNQNPSLSDSKVACISAWKNSFQDFPKIKGLEFDTTYYAKSYMILEDNSVVYSTNTAVFKTAQIGAKPIFLNSGENAFKRTPNSVYLSFVGEDGDSDITNHVFKVGKTVDTLTIVNQSRYSFRYKDAGLENMKTWVLECLPLYGLEENTDYFFSVEISNEYGTSIKTDMYILTPINATDASWLLKDTFTTRLMSNVPYLFHKYVDTATIFETKVTLNAGITTPGASQVTEYGFVLSAKNELVTVDSNDFKKIFFGSPTSEDKSFTCEFASLKQGTKYFYRAYAKNSYGISYSGPSNSFITKGSVTSNIIAPTYTNPQLSTNIVKVSNAYAILSGNVISNGNYTITKKGICWGAHENPKYLINSSKEGVESNGSFNIDIRDLENNKLYYARTFVVTAPIAEGEVPETFYGNQVSFTPSNGIAPTYPVLLTITPTIPVWDKENAWWTLNSGVAISKVGTASITTYGILVSNNIPTQLSDGDDAFTGSINSNISVTGLPASSTKYITGYGIASDNHVVFADSLQRVMDSVPTPVVPVSCGCLIDIAYQSDDKRLKVTISGTGNYLSDRYLMEYSFKSPINGKFVTDSISHKFDGSISVYYISNIDSKIYIIGAVKRDGEPYDNVYSDIKEFEIMGSPNPNPNPNPNPDINVTTDSKFSIPNTNLFVGREYIYKKRKWIYNGYSWERDFTYLTSTNVSILSAGGGSKPITATLSDVNTSENVDFLIKQENKLKVISQYITWQGVEQEPRFLNLVFDRDISNFDLAVDATLFYDNESISVTLNKLMSDETNSTLFITFSGEFEGHIYESLYDLMYVIEKAANIYLLFNENLTNHIVPVNNAKFRPEDIDFDNFEEANY